MRRLIVTAWLLGLLAATYVLFFRTTITADLLGFLPRSASPAQQLLVDQLREGVASRLLLFGIEGAGVSELAETSRAFGKELQESSLFTYVNNGEQSLSRRDQAFIFDHRYLLSPKVSEDSFSVAGLRAAFGDALARLASSAGILYQKTLAGDPTGELLAVLQPMMDRAGPASREGVWFSADGRRALLMAETRARGFDMDAQTEVQGFVDEAFAKAANGRSLTLKKAGPSVFAVS